MEKMPFQPELQKAATMIVTTTATATTTATNWRQALPVMAGSNFTLRELRKEDAPSLLAMLTAE